MVKPEQKREVLGIGLLALAVFLALALVPVHLLGEAVGATFPSGNIIGAAGARFQEAVLRFVGLGAALLPAAAAFGGLLAAGWMNRERALRLLVLSGGLLLLLPPFLHVVPAGPRASGWMGRTLGEPLVFLLGHVGAGLLLGVFFLLLTVVTLEWNPLRTPTIWAGRTLSAGGRGLADWLEGRRDPEDSPEEEDPDLDEEDPRGLRRRFPFAGLFAWGSRDGAPDEMPGDPDPRESDPALDEARLATTPSTPEEVQEEPSPATVPQPRAEQLDALLPDPRDPRELEGEELPGTGLLTAPSTRGRSGTERELDELGEVLVEKLRTFNVESEIGGRTTGPVVTQYEVIPAPGVKVNRIANLDADLALAMKARTIRIVAPIPGKGAVGVEIPNPSPEVVRLREVLESPAFTRSRGDLPLALGTDLQGEPYVADLARMPHALIAGATGSGKSVCLNTVITSLVYRHTPETLRLLLIDPKMVELSTYSDLPHLRHPVVTDPKDAAGVLKWAVIEMERRYALLKENGVRSLGEFNRRVRKGTPMRRVEPKGEEGDPDRWIRDEGVLPYIVLVVDELADLMMAVQSEVEKPLTLLAQKARAIGIHLIVATQRPSVNVITGLIKANFPCRIAFRVASKTDSRTILDQNGADALLGNGDMLFLPPGQGSPVRMQGAFVSTEETDRLMDWFRELRERKLSEDPDGAPFAEDEEDILEVVRAVEAEDSDGPEAIEGDWDELFRDAAEVVISNDQGSTSLLQRKLRIGYGRAARIVDQLHDAGVVGPPDGSKPRDVLLSMDQLDRLMSGQDPEP